MEQIVEILHIYLENRGALGPQKKEKKKKKKGSTANRLATYPTPRQPIESIRQSVRRAFILRVFVFPGPGPRTQLVFDGRSSQFVFTCSSFYS